VSLFLFPSTIPNFSPLKDEKGLASIDAIYIYIDLEGSFAFILATSSLLDLYRFRTFIIIHPYTQEVVSKRHLIYIGNLRELETSYNWYMISPRKPIVREGFDDGLPSIVLEPGNNLLMVIFRRLLGSISPAAIRNMEAFSKALKLAIGELELIVSEASREGILRYSIWILLTI
jgi:hypothetical protein